MSDNLTTGFKFTITITGDNDEVLEHFLLINPANTATRAASAVRDYLEMRYNCCDIGDEPYDE